MTSRRACKATLAWMMACLHAGQVTAGLRLSAHPLLQLRYWSDRDQPGAGTGDSALAHHGFLFLDELPA